MNAESRPSAKPVPWTSRIPWILGALLVLLIVIGLWPRALPVEVAAVARGDFAVTVDEEGMTRVKNRYTVSTPVAGQLRRIDLKAGAEVEAGRTLLAVIETAGSDFLDARNQALASTRLSSAEAAREVAAAQREKARAASAMYAADLDRSQQLRTQNVLSAQEFDIVQMRASTAAQDERAAEFALQVADFEVQQARAVLGRGTGSSGAAAEPLTITSPVSGRILRVFQESARVAPAGFPLMEIGDPSDLEARIEVLSRDAVAIQPGARVQLERWGGPAPLAARVRLVEPSAFTKVSALGVEEQRVNVIVDFADPLASRPNLGDAYRVEARIATWEGHGVLQVPAGALFQRGDAWQTFVLDGGKVRLHTVKVGHSNGLVTEITAGLGEGDQVVVYPGDRIGDGSRVTPTKQAGP